MPISSNTTTGTLPVAHSYDSTKNTTYLLEQAPVAEEVNRLNVQYQLLKTAFGYGDILDLPLDISKSQKPINILDMATGTGAWILDIARIPEVQSRIPPLDVTVANPISLYACDISTAKLSKDFIANNLGINFFLQDVTQPFPDYMKGKFDVIHTALLSWALTEEGWKAAFRNVHELLKPGGYFIVMDYDLGVEVPAEWISHQVGIDDLGINSYFTGDPSSLSDNINAVYVDMAHHAGFLLRLSRRFPDLLKSATLTPVSSKEVDFCYGPLVKGKVGLSGAPMESYMESALDIFVMAFDQVTKLALVQGKLEIPKDHKIVTEEDRKRAVAKIAAGVREKGCFEHLSEWVVQKQF